MKISMIYGKDVFKYLSISYVIYRIGFFINTHEESVGTNMPSSMKNAHLTKPLLPFSPH